MHRMIEMYMVDGVYYKERPNKHYKRCWFLEVDHVGEKVYYEMKLTGNIVSETNVHNSFEADRFVEDDSGNWYLIPVSDHAVFLDYLDRYHYGVITAKDWDNRWGDYECKHPTCYDVTVKNKG